MFDYTQITSVSNLKVVTANKVFRSLSGTTHSVGSQGNPIITGTVTWALATASEESDFWSWFDIETPWTDSNFSAMGPCEIQPTSVPVSTITEKGVSIAVEVVIFPTTDPVGIGAAFAVPVLTSRIGVESGYTRVKETAVVTTSGRATARQVTGNRGETYSISWTVSVNALAQFLNWFSLYSRRQFLASMCGKVGWLWKITDAPSYSFVGGIYVKITMTVCGRDVRRALNNVTIVSW